MTWLELMDELKKQPYYLLEKDAMVFCSEHDSDEYFIKPVTELTSPYNDSADVYEWLRHPEEFTLSVCIDI